MLFVEHFKFTEAEWADVRGEIDGLRREDERLSREAIEQIIGSWKLLASLREATPVLEKICELSQSLRDELTSEHAKKFCGALDDMIANLGGLEKGAKWWLAELPGTGKSWRSNSHRDYLIDKLNYEWLFAGGDIRVAKKSDQTPDGPLIRFLIKVCRAAGVAGLTEHMVAARVRLLRRELVRIWKADGIEAIFERLRGSIGVERHIRDLQYLAEREAEDTTFQEMLKEWAEEDIERYIDDTLYEYD